MKFVEKPWAPYSNRPTHCVVKMLIGKNAKGSEPHKWCKTLLSNFTSSPSDWRQNLEAFLMMGITNSVSHGACDKLYASNDPTDELGANLIHASMDEVRFGEVAEAILKHFGKWDEYVAMMDSAGMKIRDLWSPEIAKRMLAQAT